MISCNRLPSILVISSYYPGEDVPKTFTPVVHYFAKEWHLMGYNVLVIHTSNYFPRFFYCIPSFIRKFLEAKLGFAIPDKRLDKQIVYDYEGITVCRVPLFKLLPGSAFSPKVLLDCVSDIKSVLDQLDFRPQYIVSHWYNPQLYIINALKGVFNCKICLTSHDTVSFSKAFKNDKELVNNVDVFGFRSRPIMLSFEKEYGKNYKSFICFSGIPAYMVNNVPERNWDRPIDRFIYVGMLIKRKHADKLIPAISFPFGNDFSLDIIGSGMLEATINNQAKEFGCEQNVHLYGRLDRSLVVNHLDNAEVFVMISEKEVFGLVYLEAMSRGCIVVASRGEGMEGIVIDGYNGFMCAAGDLEELKHVLQRIKQLTSEQKSEISRNAMKTAKNYTDVMAAESYINNVIQL